MKTESSFHFPREERLKGTNEIRETFKRKKCVSCPGAKLFLLKNGLPHNRIAFAFPRKYGTAVERNRSRRLSREVYRLLRNQVRWGYDLVLLVYPGQDLFSTRRDQLEKLLTRAGLWNSPDGQES